MKTFMALACFVTVTTAVFAASPTVPADATHQSSKKETKKHLSARQSGEDHLGLALQYREKAAENDAQGAAYEQAAATYRNGPMIKNLISVTTPGRYEYIAKTYREKATTDRELAASHENMAKLSSGL
jgi:hypothetical protein